MICVTSSVHVKFHFTLIIKRLWVSLRFSKKRVTEINIHGGVGP